jgi:hypothetical protein
MRAVSAEYMQSLFARETSLVTAVLLTIDHSSLAQPIRVTSDAVDTVSNGNTFIVYPFKLVIPTDEEDAQPTAQLTIDNVGRGVIAALRSATGEPPTVLIEIVKSTDWDTVEVSIPGFLLANVKFDVFTITGDLVYDAKLNEPCPTGRFTTGFFPNVS